MAQPKIILITPGSNEIDKMLLNTDTNVHVYRSTGSEVYIYSKQ